MMGDGGSGQENRSIAGMQRLVSCPTCEGSNAQDSRYCQYCGASLTVAKEAETLEVGTSRKQGILGKLFGRRRK